MDEEQKEHLLRSPTLGSDVSSEGFPERWKKRDGFRASKTQTIFLIGLLIFSLGVNLLLAWPMKVNYCPSLIPEQAIGRLSTFGKIS